MKNLLSQRAAVLLILGGAALGHSWDVHPDAVEQFMNAEMERQHIPGLAVLVERGGKIVCAQAALPTWSIVCRSGPILYFSPVRWAKSLPLLPS